MRFLVRRVLENIWNSKDKCATFLALDWEKAFDLVSPSALTAALKRFGCTNGFISVICSIYQDRRFVVRDCGYTLDKHHQNYGISQGCPLSPFFVCDCYNSLT